MLTQIRYRPPKPGCCQTARHHGRSQHEHNRFRYSNLDPVCRILAIPNSFQLDLVQYHKTWCVYLYSYYHLGSDLCCHGSRQHLPISPCCPSHSRCGRGCLFPRCHLPAFGLVHKARTGKKVCWSIHRSASGVREVQNDSPTTSLILYRNAFGGLIAAGILKLDGVHGIRGWRWLFIM